MSKIKELREKFNKMNEQEIQRELLIIQVLIAKSLENLVDEMKGIRQNIDKFRLY